MQCKHPDCREIVSDESQLWECECGEVGCIHCDIRETCECGNEYCEACSTITTCHRCGMKICEACEYRDWAGERVCECCHGDLA